jgi:hypothetical protein
MVHRSMKLWALMLGIKKFFKNKIFIFESKLIYYSLYFKVILTQILITFALALTEMDVKIIRIQRKILKLHFSLISLKSQSNIIAYLLI